MATTKLAGKSGARLTAGSFFAMSGDMRSDAYTLMGGDRMASLNAETRALRGQRLKVGGMQGLSTEMDARLAGIGSAWAENAAKVVNSFSNVASSAAQVQALFLTLPGIVRAALAGFMGGNGAPTVTAPTASIPPQAAGLVTKAVYAPGSPNAPWLAPVTVALRSFLRTSNAVA